jgi:uncharacterized membrane protein YdjX (TVP38/TMEM64 family)
MKTRYLVIFYLAMIIIFFIYKDPIIYWMQFGHAPILLIFLIAVGFIIFPVLPFKIVIGVLGYIYGTLLGALISWSAATVGSVIIFLLVQLFFLKQGQAYLLKFKRVEKLKIMIEKSPFFAILIARMIPIMPQGLVNVYVALIPIRLLTYTLASAIGKIPGMIVYAYIGKHLLSDMDNLFIAIGIYALFLLFTYLIYRLWLKNKFI